MAKSKADKARLDAIHAMPCIACEMEKVFSKETNHTVVSQPSRTEAHHIVDKGYRKHSGGDMATLPLCGWHHRGELLFPLSSHEMLLIHGPSLARHKAAFKAVYGTERELLEKVDEQLNKRDAA